MEEVDGQDWNNYLSVGSGVGSFYYNRGAWPNSPDTDVINVGALQDHAEFRRSTYTQFGAGVTVFAPGDQILSSYGNTGFNDTKYTQGSGNYFYPINETSMASPQVCGVIACLATGKERFTQADALGYLQKTSIDGDMTFDVAGGGLADNSCRQGSPNKYLRMENPRPIVGYPSEISGNRTSGMTYPRDSIYKGQSPKALPKTFPINVTNSGANHYVFNGDDRNTTHVDAFDPIIYINSGDTLQFSVNASGHPFWIKTSNTTGTGDGVTTGTITNNGTAVGTVTWDTTGVVPGTYYYICQFHSGMVGQISIS